LSFSSLITNFRHLSDFYTVCSRSPAEETAGVDARTGGNLQNGWDCRRKERMIAFGDSGMFFPGRA
jgi:hypothetical protein